MSESESRSGLTASRSMYSGRDLRTHIYRLGSHTTLCGWPIVAALAVPPKERADCQSCIRIAVNEAIHA